MTFSALYVYGHLPAIAFSLSMALACAAVALRIPEARKDLALSAVYLLTSATTALELWLARRPSLAAGRAYLVLGGAVLFSLIVTFHLYYASEVLPEPRRRVYVRALVATAGYGFLLLVLLSTGALDEGQVRVGKLWGARASLPSMRPWACGLCAIFAFSNVPLCAEIYLRDKPKGRARWLVSSGVWAGPLVAAWDLAICAGLNPYVPLGGYLAALVGIEGAVQLVERLRTMPPPGKSVAGYRLEKRLGSGGMADVFVAARRPTGMTGVVQRVALKRLRTDLASDPHFVNMFLDEARILARLSHPNIVQLLEAGRDEDQLYLAMELVEGATVQQIFRAANARGERASSALVVEVGVQLCAALECAHALTSEDGRSLELVHRDISPQNVLVDRHGTVKLSDFGIARSADRLTETATGLVKGKASYMAPEQIQGGFYDHRVDLYAVGVILFELLTGERLHKASSDAALLYALAEGRTDRMTLLDRHDHPLADAVRAVLATDPQQRTPSAAALRAQLASLRADDRGREELVCWVDIAMRYGQASEHGPQESADASATIRNSPRRHA